MVPWQHDELECSRDRHSAKLSRTGHYTAEIYSDADDAAQRPKNVSIHKQTVDASMSLKANLAPGGGYAVRFMPIAH